MGFYFAGGSSKKLLDTRLFFSFSSFPHFFLLFPRVFVVRTEVAPPFPSSGARLGDMFLLGGCRVI